MSEKELHNVIDDIIALIMPYKKGRSFVEADALYR
jgi:hypothetical protein